MQSWELLLFLLGHTREELAFVGWTFELCEVSGW